MNIFNNERLKELRKGKGYTQLQLAEQIHVARTTYAEYEQGKIQPPLEKVHRICQIFNVRISEFLDVENDTGIDISQLQNDLTDAEKILKIRKIEDKKIKAAHADKIIDTVNDSSLEIAEKEVLVAVTKYIKSRYTLNKYEMEVASEICDFGSDLI